jgi:hypothetical protein
MRPSPTIPSALAIAGDSEMFWISHFCGPRELFAYSGLPHNN